MCESTRIELGWGGVLHREPRSPLAAHTEQGAPECRETTPGISWVVRWKMPEVWGPGLAGLDGIGRRGRPRIFYRGWLGAVPELSCPEETPLITLPRVRARRTIPARSEATRARVAHRSCRRAR